MNIISDTKSISERGTLAHLKNVFEHRNVKSNVMDSFNYADNFIRFVTVAYCTYLAMDMLCLATAEEVPVCYLKHHYQSEGTTCS